MGLIANPGKTHLFASAYTGQTKPKLQCVLNPVRMVLAPRVLLSHADMNRNLYLRRSQSVEFCVEQVSVTFS